MAASNILISRLTNAPRAMVRYIKESYIELRKVSWPSRQTTIQYTLIVAISSIAVGMVIGGIDFLLALALERIII